MSQAKEGGAAAKIGLIIFFNFEIDISNPHPASCIEALLKCALDIISPH
jgi:hypothetical protein